MVSIEIYRLAWVIVLPLEIRSIDHLNKSGFVNVLDQNDAVIRNASADNTAMNSEIARNIKLTAAHEIGHMPRGGDETSHHAENMLMDEDGYGSDNGLKFSPKSILRFRKTNQWQQP